MSNLEITINGMPELIRHQDNGYLAKPYDSRDLADGIPWILKDKERYFKLAQQSRTIAQTRYSHELQASRYVELFQKICNQTKTHNLT